MLAPSGVAKDFNKSLPIIGNCIRAVQVGLVHQVVSKFSAGYLLTLPPLRKCVKILLKSLNLSPPVPQNVYVPNSSLGKSNTKGAGRTSKEESPHFVPTTKSSSVTDLMMQRVNDPRYLQPGGFPMLMLAPEVTAPPPPQCYVLGVCAKCTPCTPLPTPMFVHAHS